MRNRANFLSVALLISLISFGFTGIPANGQVPQPGWPAITKEAKPWTRWWWLGSAVDREGITFRLDEMAKAGIGGVEITPIYGTKGFENKYVEFLSPAWMTLLAHTVNEGKRLNMGIDMNTGTGWPFGGPKVSVEDGASKYIIQTYSITSGNQLADKIIVNDA